MPFALGPAEAVAMRKQMAAEVVAIVSGAAVTRAQLLAAFALVEDSTNWKNPIDRVVNVEAVRAVGGIPMITEAVVFYAGCIPSFDRVPEGYRVQAIGYFRAVGA